MHKIQDEVVYDGIVLTEKMASTLPEVLALETTPEDVFIATYGRSGKDITKTTKKQRS